ncbi:MAG: hypothetical protein ACOC22_02325 [bacterium]
MSNRLKIIIREEIRECLNEYGHENYKDNAIDLLYKKYGLNKNIVYHGSPDITYLKSIGDIDTVNNTQNAKSKYIFVNNKPSIAINYSSDYNNRFTPNSGIAVFLLKGKGYVMKKHDIPIAFKSMDDFELFLDEKKTLGYDFVKIPQDGNNIAILNVNVLTLMEIFKIM